jgi:hypothetical protein
MKSEDRWVKPTVAAPIKASVARKIIICGYRTWTLRKRARVRLGSNDTFVKRRPYTSVVQYKFKSVKTPVDFADLLRFGKDLQCTSARYIYI